MAVGAEMENVRHRGRARPTTRPWPRSTPKAGAKVYDLDEATLKKWQAIARDTAWKDYAAKSETCAALLKAAQKLA